MEPIDVAVRVVVIMVVVAGAGSVALILYTLWHSRRARPQAAPPVAPSPKVAGPIKCKPSIIYPLPGASAEESRNVTLASDTLQQESHDFPELVDLVWVAAVPRTFNIDLLKVLYPPFARKLYLLPNLRRLLFVQVVPHDHYAIEPSLRRAMLHQLFHTDACRAELIRLSTRSAKYFYKRLLSPHATRYDRRTRFVGESFFRFLNTEVDWPAAQIEWLYHLAIADGYNASNALWELGNAWMLHDRWDELTALLTALFEHVDDQRVPNRLRAMAYYFRGRLALHSSRIDAALLDLEESRHIEYDDPVLERDTLAALGQAAKTLSLPDRSLQAESVARADREPAGSSRRQWLMREGTQLPDPRGDTLKRYEELLAVYRHENNWLSVGNTLRQIGDEHRMQNQPAAALDWYYQALAAFRRSGPYPLEEASTLKMIGDVQFLLRRNEGALASYADALEKYEQLQMKSPLGEADARKARADVLYFDRRFADALEDYNRARIAYRLAGAQLSEADALLAQGQTLQALGQTDQAKRCFNDALDLHQRGGNQVGTAQVLLVIGDSTYIGGNYTDALQQFEQARDNYRAAQNPIGEASALKAMGDALAQLKRGEAEQSYQDAMKIYRAVDARLGEANVQLALGQLYLGKRRYEQAWGEFEAACDLFKALGDHLGEARAKLAMGEVRRFERNSAEAVRLYKEAWKLFDTVGYEAGKAQATLSWADEQMMQQHADEQMTEKVYEMALHDYETALNLYEAIGGHSAAVEETLGRIGHAEIMLSRRNEALQAYDKAIARRSPLELGWRGYRALVEGDFNTAAEHFQSVLNYDDRVSWRSGQALAKFGSGALFEAVDLMEGAMQNANSADRAEACRWLKHVLKLKPELTSQAYRLELQC